MNNTLRWCSDIGMWSLDRPINDIPNTNITGSCVNRTSFCDVTCYNLKLYRMFPAMLTKDKSDVQRVRILCEEFPDIIWWLPTRAWRNAELRDLVQRYLMPLPNLALNASLDPTNTENEIRLLTADGWSTMFYGDDTREYSPTMRGMERMFKCPKTHKKLKNHCGICKGGCFGLTSIGRRTDVHLSQH